jgi:hypothetical protein
MFYQQNLSFKTSLALLEDIHDANPISTIPLYTMFAQLRTLIQLVTVSGLKRFMWNIKSLTIMPTGHNNLRSRPQMLIIPNRTKLPSNVKGKQVIRGSF